LAIIGEAVRAIPPELEAAHPEIPWDDVRGMRNIVIHEYFQFERHPSFFPYTETLKGGQYEHLYN
jgi:uncharacterized protein with HEPN domain